MKQGAASRYIIPVLAVFMLLFAIYSIASKPKQLTFEPALVPATAQYTARVAGLGIAEPKSEIIAIGTNVPGIITQVMVKAGDHVKAGDALFLVDDRESRAQLAVAQAQLTSAQVASSDAKDQYNLYQTLTVKQAASKEQRNRRYYNAWLAEAKLKESEANIIALETQIDRLSVKAPIDATILKVNIRPGEYAPVGTLKTPLIILGDISKMHVRVSIDESEALRVKPEARAEASLRGAGEQKIPLTFVRKELYMQPKNSLTGEGNERVDTRIQEIVYSFDNTSIGAYAGQQMDVYIQASELRQ